jgi:hypothetical protein
MVGNNLKVGVLGWRKTGIAGYSRQRLSDALQHNTAQPANTRRTSSCSRLSTRPSWRPTRTATESCRLRSSPRWSQAPTLSSECLRGDCLQYIDSLPTLWHSADSQANDTRGSLLNLFLPVLPRYPTRLSISALRAHVIHADVNERRTCLSLILCCAFL